MIQGSREAEEETDATSAALRQRQAGQRSRVLPPFANAFTFCHSPKLSLDVSNIARDPRQKDTRHL